MKLLCIDDEQTFLQYLVKRLMGQGFEVISAFSGEEALILAVKERFDAALIDLVMPGMDGVQVQEHLNRIDPGLPCIFLASSKTQDNTSVSVDSDESLYIVEKPLDVQSLINVVHAAVQKRQVSAQPETEPGQQP